MQLYKYQQNIQSTFFSNKLYRLDLQLLSSPPKPSFNSISLIPFGTFFRFFLVLFFLQSNHFPPIHTWTAYFPSLEPHESSPHSIVVLQDVDCESWSSFSDGSSRIPITILLVISLLLFSLQSYSPLRSYQSIDYSHYEVFKRGTFQTSLYLFSLSFDVL